MKKVGGLLFLFLFTLGLIGLWGLDTLADDAGSKLPQADPALGVEIYKKACFVCHDSGLMGAPKLGDIEAWKAKTDKGMETLFKNVINGYQGEVGYMPPRGGNMDLSDQEVFSALVYMIEKSR
jgi:cytochrome c